MYTYRNCITPEGRFVYGIHKPSYSVRNMRPTKHIKTLGLLPDGTDVLNERNYPAEDLTVERAKWIYEIPNPFPFRGTTFIDKAWADGAAEEPERMQLGKPEDFSLTHFLRQNDISSELIDTLPRPLLLTLATCSNDPNDLISAARKSCEFVIDENGIASGLRHSSDGKGGSTPIIHDHELFEAVANNPHLPDSYKEIMVLRPGAQGGSEIVAEWQHQSGSHIFEYLRRNSYIAGGHYAANMADDAVRYAINDLSREDMQGLRHLYYQRLFIIIADRLGIEVSAESVRGAKELEELRLQISAALDDRGSNNIATLWGWNFGFDFSPTTYRLHASHQQIHQQYALIPESVPLYSSGSAMEDEHLPSFCCGDLIAQVIADYDRHHASDFFSDYFQAIQNNARMDGRKEYPKTLIVWEDSNVLLFVPKAQTSQWELQIMAKPDKQGAFPGNIIEASLDCRHSFDTALLLAQQIFEKLGAKMVTSFEFSKRIGERDRRNQPLIYSLLPKLPFSPGAFSEAQLRFINGHYPEDFAALCAKQLTHNPES